MTDWLEVAQQLPLGHKRRIQHECGEGRDMVVSHGQEGYSAYCFRCGPVGFHSHGYRNLAEIQRIKELNERARNETTTMALPRDFSLTIPQPQAQWLHNAGISDSYANTLGFGYSEYLGRVVLPVYDAGGSLIYWQARAVHAGQTPKYINPQVEKATLCYWCKPLNDNGGKERVVITEDILSAARIGKHTLAASILGTKTSDWQASKFARYDRVTYWLDPDQAGYDGSRAGVRKLGLVTHGDAIYSNADPKCLSDRLIREHLGLEPNHRWRVE